MKVRIEVRGCDDSTIVEMDVTPEEHEFLENLQREVNDTSTYGCMPKLYLEEIGDNESES